MIIYADVPIPDAVHEPPSLVQGPLSGQRCFPFRLPGRTHRMRQEQQKKPIERKQFEDASKDLVALLQDFLRVHIT